MEPELKPCVTREGRSMSTTTTLNVAANGTERDNSKVELERAPPLAAHHVDIKSHKPTCGGKTTFFQGGLVAKAHKKIFRSRSSSNNHHQGSGGGSEGRDDNSTDEEVNLIYSNVMIPLEFPTAEDEGNGFIIVSPIDTPDFRNHPFASSPRKKFSSLPVQHSSTPPLPSRRVPLPSTPCSSSAPRIA